MLQAPHRHIQAKDETESFLIKLLDTLWERYRRRMKYVRQYEAMIESHRARFVNDHVAFRTLAAQDPAAGIFSISRIFEALGYSSAACYEFPDKHFNSIHYRHPNPGFPKLFITQLKTWELSKGAQKIIQKSLKTHRPPLALEALSDLSKRRNFARLLKTLVRYFAELPWDVPQKHDVLELNKESQFGAWVLVNGYDVNHFTASVDSHGAVSLNDIEKTVDAMTRAGIPMKKDIEGGKGTKLRQSSTDAVVINVKVKEGASTVQIPWSYAYFEIAERPLIKNPLTQAPERFEGFLGGQAANLFDVTKLK